MGNYPNVRRDAESDRTFVETRSAERLLRTMSAHDPPLTAHGEAVAHLMNQVAPAAPLDHAELGDATLVALLHDVGKVRVPRALLRSRGPLDRPGWALMRRHAEWGAQLVAAQPGLKRLAPMIRHHHEHVDGSGYPAGLAGDEIPLISRLTGVCDAYCAMVGPRPYSASLSHSEAMDQLWAAATTQFDTEIVEMTADVVGDLNLAPMLARVAALA